MSQGLIFDIKKYSINDGPGIRTTVFFKGCPLRCPWCHNPEGQSFEPELMVKASRCLKECSECLTVCEPRALSKISDLPVLDRLHCTACGNCADVCPTQALEVVGRRVDASAIMAEIEKERIFQEQSGGGVTFSGGEPLSQPDFLAELLSQCRKKEIHTSVDTCGFASPQALEKIAGKVDLFLFDLKLMDDKKHRKYTGETNRIILENLRFLVIKEKKIVVRLPLISGINDDDANIKQTAKFLRALNGVNEISLLPYHKLGRDKYKGLQKKNTADSFSPPSEERLEKIKKDLERSGFTVRRGG